MFGESAHDDVTLESIDFEWVRKTSKIQKLKKALYLLEQDGSFFTDLIKAVQDRMTEIDPKFIKKEFNREIPTEEKQEAAKEVQSWTDEVDQIGSKEIFKQQSEDRIALEKKKKLADNEKNKGNEALRSNDLAEALNYYTKSIQYDPTMAASYCNRALVYLKQKKYEDCIKDCDTALELQKDYGKAIHRRAKANYALKNYVKAYKDFKLFLETEPDNSEVNGELKECSKLLSAEQLQMAENSIVFKKVQIIEQDDESDEEVMKSNVKTIENFKQQVDQISQSKNDATDQIKKGMFNKAIDILTDALRKTLKIQEELTIASDLHFIIVLRCQLIGNISLCYKQLGDYANIINYTTKVVEESQHLQDCPDLLIKVLLRRAMAYESTDRVVKSKLDYMSVKRIDPGNLQASTGLKRLAPIMSETENKAFNDQWSILLESYKDFKFYQPIQQQEVIEEQEIVQPIVQEQQQHQEQQKPIVQEQQQHQEQQKPIVQEQQQHIAMTQQELNSKLNSIKEQGNQLFKEKKFQESFDKFNEGAIIFESAQSTDSNTKSLFVQLLTNSCLCLSNLSNHKEIINIANKVLLIDEKNLKALYRRGLAYVSWSEEVESSDASQVQLVNELLERARKDLEKIVYLDKDNKQAIIKLNEVQMKNANVRMKLKQEKEKEKVEEKEKLNVIKVNNFVEQQEEQKQSKPSLNKQKLDSIASLVTKGLIEKLLKSPCPENASTFEKNMGVFKNENSGLLIDYVAGLDVENFKKIYARKDLPPELLVQLLKAFKEQLSQRDQIIKIINMLPSSSKFSLTVKCLSKKEKVQLLEVVESLNLEQEPLAQIKLVYNI